VRRSNPRRRKIAWHKLASAEEAGFAAPANINWAGTLLFLIEPPRHQRIALFGDGAAARGESSNPRRGFNGWRGDAVPRSLAHLEYAVREPVKPPPSTPQT
jgi:hypothetical protein